MGLKAPSGEFRALRITPLATPDSRATGTCTAGVLAPRCVGLAVHTSLCWFANHCSWFRSVAADGVTILQGSVSGLVLLSSAWILFCVVFTSVIFGAAHVLWPCCPSVRYRSCCPPLSAVGQATAKSHARGFSSPFRTGTDGCLVKFPGGIDCSKGYELFVDVRHCGGSVAFQMPGPHGKALVLTQPSPLRVLLSVLLLSELCG